MGRKVCRLCLSKVNLSPLFRNCEQIAEYSSVLFLTTGIKIGHTDGLPQKICEKCNDAVNSAIELRNRSRLTQDRLLELKEQDNKLIKDVKAILFDDYVDYEDVDIKEDNAEELDEKIDIVKEENLSIIKEIIADNEGLNENTVETAWPPPASIVKLLSKKDKREFYLSFVDGAYDPDGPVTCKLCKNTVRSWACFLNHCKIHLGSDFVCEYCGKGMFSLARLNKHMKSHEGLDRDLRCEHCNYHALDIRGLKLHKHRKHTGERVYVCEICGSSHHSNHCSNRHNDTVGDLSVNIPKMITTI